MRVSDIGRPLPEIDLDRQIRSGWIPAGSNEKNVPVRPQPAWMSSTMSNTSWRLQHSESRCSQEKWAVWSPPSPWTVSTMTAATEVDPSASIVSSTPTVSTSSPSSPSNGAVS